MQDTVIVAPVAAKATSVVASTPKKPVAIAAVASQMVVRVAGTTPLRRYKRKQPAVGVTSKTSASLMEKALVAAKANEDKEKKAKQERDALLVVKAAKLQAKLTVMKRPAAAAAKASQPPEPPSVAAAKASQQQPPAKMQGKNEGDKTEEVVEECGADDDEEVQGEDGGTAHEAGEEEEKETDDIVEPEDEDSVGHATVIFGVCWGGEGKGRGACCFWFLYSARPGKTFPAGGGGRREDGVGLSKGGRQVAQ
jgi:hypothetical protein